MLLVVVYEVRVNVIVGCLCGQYVLLLVTPVAAVLTNVLVISLSVTNSCICQYECC
jgi:hypothetical protein